MNYKQYTNNPVIERYCKEANVEKDTAKKHFEVLKQFLFLCSKSEEPCFPSNELDEIWHTFILFTKDYYTFCIDGLGKFVHHIPFNNQQDKANNFQPGYFCFVQENRLKKKYVKNLTQLETIYLSNCGSGGDCSSCSSCRD